MKTTAPFTDSRESPFAAGGECWWLTVAHHRESDLIGRRFVVFNGARVAIGRGEHWFGRPIFDDDKVSRNHAEVVADEQSTLSIRDVDSRNGTFVDGERVTEAALQVGSVIAIGRVMLVATRAPASSHGERASGDDELFGVSYAMTEVRRQVDKVIDHETTVVVIGPPGCGKTALAQHMHRRRASSRTERGDHAGNFVYVACGGFPAELLHSELFGHVAQAFGREGESRRGLIETAAGGTVLLDDIANAPDALQLSLLRFLDSGEIRKLGADAPLHVDARVIATANEPLQLLVDAGRLRSDFADRLARWQIHMPPLAERREDIPLLAWHFARKYGGDDMRIDRRLTLHLLRRDWPGNVRELEAFIEAAVIDAQGKSTLSHHASGDPSVDAPSGRYTLAQSGAWFTLPDGSEVELRGRDALQRVLRALLERRKLAPGRPCSVPELLAAGWPGEELVRASGANRVYVALTTLRKLGLRDLIERKKAGYLIAANAPVKIL